MDPVEFVKGTVSPMAHYTFPYITGIVGVIDANEGEHVGTGFRCVFGGRRCLITAKHVIDEANSYSMGPAFVAQRGAPPVPLLRTPDIALSSVDLAVYFLPDATDTEDARFWPEARIDMSAENRAADYLFIHGFPGERARFAFGDLHKESLPYGVMERDDDLPLDKRAEEFAVDYDYKNMLLETTGGAVGDLVEHRLGPPGLSGSPVWRIGARRIAPEQWSPERCQLVGVVTRWNHDKKVLLAVGAAELVKLMRAA